MVKALSVEHVSWSSQGQSIINDISFNLAPGQMLALVGPNGAGKSTLLRCLSGYYTPSAGRVLINGQHLAPGFKRARLVAYMPQNAPAIMDMSVAQAIMLGRRPYLRFKPSPQDTQITSQAMECLALSHLAHKSVRLISAGEYQRVLLARTLAQDAPIMLLDEPLNNLDPAYQLIVLDLLGKLAAERGRAIVLSMHDLNLTSRFCPYSLLLHQGRALALGASEQALNPDNLKIAYGLTMRIQRAADNTLYFIPFLE